MTEEDVKVQHVMPRLQEMGLEVTDLRLETTFSIQVGRQTHKVGGGIDDGKKVSGRADIIVKRAGKPLLVVEVKDDDVAFTDAERDQVVSYALLHNPIVPVAALMNGREVRLFDPITRDPIAADTLVASTGRTLTLNEDARREAIACFIGFSPENTRWFCGRQLEDAVLPYTTRGPDGDLPRHVDGLYVEPAGLSDAWNAFAQGPHRTMLVTGSAGAGKSSWLVSRALRSKQSGDLCLFFRGVSLRNGLVRALAEELSWTLSPNLNDVAAADRFAKTLHGNRLTLFLDGLDEEDPAVSRRALDEVIQRFPSNVRMVAACKATRLSELMLESDGLPTRWYPTMGGRSVDAGNLSERDVGALVRKHRQYFNINLRLTDTMLDDARGAPSIVRTVFQVAAEAGVDAVSGYNSQQFFARHVDARLKRFGREQGGARQTLAALAKRLHESNVEDMPLAAALQLGTEELLRACMDRGFLRTVPASNGERVRFEESRVRDYLAIRDGHGWMDMSAAQLCGVAQLVTPQAGVQLEAAELFYLLASPEQRALFDGHVRANCTLAMTTLERSVELIGQHVGERLRPPVSERGFAAYLSLPRKEAIAAAFVHRRPGAGKVFIWPRASGSFEDDTAFSLGARSLYSVGRDGLTDPDAVPDFVFWRCLAKELGALLDEGGLDEGGCLPLLSERAAALAVTLGCAQSAPMWFTALPTAIVDVRRAVIFRRAERDYLATLPPAQVVDYGDMVVEFRSLTNAAREEARKHAEALVAARPHDFPSMAGLESEGEMEAELWRILGELEALGASLIEGTMPAPDDATMASRRSGWTWELWKPETIEKIGLRLAEGFMSSLPSLVERNFSPRAALGLMQRARPDAKLIVLSSRENESLRFWHVSDSSDALKRVQRFEDLSPPVRARYTTRGGGLSLGYHGMSLGGVISPMKNYLPKRWKLKTQLTPLRSLVYGEIKSRLTDVLRVLAPEVGADPDGR